MDNRLITLIDNEIESCTTRLAADTVRLVNIKSVQDEAMPGAPFGEGAKRVLDTFVEMAGADGFYTTDYGVGVVSAAMKEGECDLGIWLHGDVVPEGDGWSFPPYDATEYKGCIIGRGATDNKGQMSAVLNLFRIFKKLDIKLNYNPAIYIGSNEETGMEDMIGHEGNPDARGFMNVCKPPRLSLVPDGSFPVGYGGKGGMNITLRSKTPLHGVTLTAGQKESPGLARATFENADIPEMTAFTPPRHGSSPDPDGNMITRISEALLESDYVSDEDKYIFEFFRTVSLDVQGKMLGIATECENMKPLTVFSKAIDDVDGHPEITLNIRYPIGITFDEIVERVSAYAESVGFTVSKKKCGVLPYMLDPTSEIVTKLAEIANGVTGSDKKPYTLSGGTYAHRLPNAYVFGTDGNLPPDDFEKGRGGAHGIDEAVSLDRLKRAMKIYARALLSLNDIRW